MSRLKRHALNPLVLIALFEEREREREREREAVREREALAVLALAFCVLVPVVHTEHCVCGCI